jgi:hypothetical protein
MTWKIYRNWKNNTMFNHSQSIGLWPPWPVSKLITKWYLFNNPCFDSRFISNNVANLYKMKYFCWKVLLALTKDFRSIIFSATHVKISQLVNKMCSQQACSKLINKLEPCWYFINLLQGCHSQVVDKVLNYRTITSCWSNL